MSGRTKTLAKAISGLVGATSIVPQVGFDLDPIIFAPLEDAVLELLTLPGGSDGTILPSFGDTKHGTLLTNALLGKSLNVNWSPAFVIFALLICSTFGLLYAMVTKDQQIANLEGMCRNLTSEKAKLKTGTALERAATRRVQGELNARNRQLVSMQQELRQREQDEATLTGHSEEQTQRNRKLEQDVHAASTSAKEQEELVSSMNARLEELTQRNQKLEKRLHKSSTSAKEHEEHVSSMVKQHENTMNNLNAKVKQLEAQDATIKQLGTRATDLNKVIETKEKAIRQHQAQVTSLKSDQVHQKNTIERLTADNATLASAYGKLASAVGELQSQDSTQKNTRPILEQTETDPSRSEPSATDAKPDLSASEWPKLPQQPHAANEPALPAQFSSEGRNAPTTQLATKMVSQMTPSGRPKVTFIGAGVQSASLGKPLIRSITSGQAINRTTEKGSDQLSAVPVTAKSAPSAGLRVSSGGATTAQTALGAWQNFAVTTPQREEEMRQGLRAKYAELEAYQRRTGVKPNVSFPSIKETFRQVRMGSNDQREISSTAKRTFDPKTLSSHPSSAPASARSIALAPTGALGPDSVRRSSKPAAEVYTPPGMRQAPAMPVSGNKAPSVAGTQASAPLPSTANQQSGSNGTGVPTPVQGTTAADTPTGQEDSSRKKKQNRRKTRHRQGNRRGAEVAAGIAPSTAT
ncbi:MAG: hypothetical protein L6R35_005335 [Caloplaca aegaea]|nr:MAG: hypothetical protein L6R35_005335 [Caloplaca aegaea]